MIKVSHIYGVKSIKPERIMNFDSWGEKDIRMMPAQQLVDNCAVCVRSDLSANSGFCKTCLDYNDSVKKKMKPFFRPIPDAKEVLDKDLRWLASKPKRDAVARSIVPNLAHL